MCWCRLWARMRRHVNADDCSVPRSVTFHHHQVSIKVHGTGDVLYVAPSNLDIRNDELAPGATRVQGSIKR
jgi:hypothetical protein